MELSETYRLKVAACGQAIKAIGSEPGDLLMPYSGMPFPGTEVDRAKAFGEVLQAELTPEVYRYFTAACDLPYLRDTRQPHEYAVDLVLGWLIEDAAVRNLASDGGAVVLSGHDRYREFLSPQKISTQPDIRIGDGDTGRLIEIFSDWKGTWRRQNHADLRDNKYGRLKSEGALLLGIAPVTSEGFLIDFNIDDGGFEANFIPAYRKQGYTTKKVRSLLKPLDEIMDDARSRVVVVAP